MFTYHIPTKVYFGKGVLNGFGKAVKEYGYKALIVYGGGSVKKSGVYDTVTDELKNNGIDYIELGGIEPNPKIDSVRNGVMICKEQNIDFVIALGGGSSMDASKFICAASCTDTDVWTIIKDKIPLKKVLPLICVPTIAATGSEMDNTAVLNNPLTKEKCALIDDKLFPFAAFCDPELTYSVNEYQTACGSADIFSHILEVYLNKNQNLYMLDTQMEGMLKTVVKYAPLAVKEPCNYEARSNLMWTSSWAINGYIYGCNKNPWSCHPIEHQLSAVYDITHGLGLAIITPAWMEYILDKTNTDRFCMLGTNVFGIDSSLDKKETALKTIECVKDFFYNKLCLKSRLSELGINSEHFEEMAQKACGLNGYINGYKALYPKDVINIYYKCL